MVSDRRRVSGRAGRRREVLRSALRGVRMTPFIPHQPTVKQRIFMMLPHKEVGFGGSAGGGKSDALLMAAAQYVDVPGYNAILFRKSLTDLQLSDALIPRSHEWFTGRADWNGSLFKWTFPSGATLAFGYLSDSNTKYRYMGAQFQFIGFDELTQFPEADYTYLFSRLRKLEGSGIPLRMRSATNPGGVGHLWVRRRFKIAGKEIGGRLRYVGGDKQRPFVPSFLSDNPYLDQQTYIDSLSYLDPVTREQLLHGDWGVAADGRFRSGWAKYFTQRPYGWVTLGPKATGEAVNLRETQRFMVVDPAASAKEGPADSHWRKTTSSSVIGYFGRTLAHNHLLFLDCRMGRWEIPELISRIVDMYKEYDPDYIAFESSGLGIGIVTTLESMGLPIRRVNPQNQDKLVKATDASNRMERGQIWFPESAEWLEDVQAQLFTWTGHPDEPDDVIDVLAYAAKEVSRVARDEASLFGFETVAANPYVIPRPDVDWSMQ